MNAEISLWVNTLVGASNGPTAPEIQSLTDSCRMLEAQISSYESPLDLSESESRLEAMVAALREEQSLLQQKCDRLQKEVESMLEKRQSDVLTRFDAASHQVLFDEAKETIRRASSFFGIEFSAMSPAQIRSRAGTIKRKVVTEREVLEKRFVDAAKVLEDNILAIEKAKEAETELAQLRSDIVQLESRLREEHNVEPAVFEALGKFSASEIKTYHRDVIEVRLNDARYESARGLSSWSMT